MSKKTIDISAFKFDGSQSLELQNIPNKIDSFYDGKKEYKRLIEDYQKEIDAQQAMMYAHDKYSLLLIFQAMDAAGKDGTIRHVLSGVNPHGIFVNAFKRPSENELDHDFMWRTTTKLPPRGKIGVYNRSYYEEVLVVRVHEGILTNAQRIPKEFINPVSDVWDQRLTDIKNFEKYLHRNGTKVVKFFLNLSKDEQRDRFLDRLNRQEKNWKFEEGDLKERRYWDQYQAYYEEAINATATADSPWYVIPADDKKNMRLMVAQAVYNTLDQMDMQYPEVDEARAKDFQKFRDILEND